MFWWVVVVLVVGSLLVLAVVTAPLLRRLNEMGVAARRLRLRAVEAQQLVPAVTAVLQRTERLRGQLTAVQEKVARGRGTRRPDGS